MGESYCSQHIPQIPNYSFSSPTVKDVSIIINTKKNVAPLRNDPKNLTQNPYSHFYF